MSLSRSRFLSFAPFVMLLSMLVGCDDSPATGDVSGKITVDGKPLPYGSIAFLNADGSTGSGTIENGRYHAPKVPVGDNKIVVQSLQFPPMMVDLSETPAPKDQKGSPQLPHIPIPARYSNAEQSGLSFTVAEGEQTHDIELTGR